MKTRAVQTVLATALSISAAHAANVSCPASKLLPGFDASFHECSHGFQNGSCEKFVQTFTQLLPKFDCQRPFDTAPVPAIWLANDAALEDYERLLSKLKQPDARKLFASPEFRAVLDGATAEEYVPMSLKAEHAASRQVPSNHSSKRTREKPRAA